MSCKQTAPSISISHHHQSSSSRSCLIKDKVTTPSYSANDIKLTVPCAQADTSPSKLMEKELQQPRKCHTEKIHFMGVYFKKSFERSEAFKMIIKTTFQSIVSLVSVLLIEAFFALAQNCGMVLFP